MVSCAKAFTMFPVTYIKASVKFYIKLKIQFLCFFQALTHTHLQIHRHSLLDSFSSPTSQANTHGFPSVFHSLQSWLYAYLGVTQKLKSFDKVREIGIGLVLFCLGLLIESGMWVSFKTWFLAVEFFLIEFAIWVSVLAWNPWFGGELWKESAEDAAAGSRVPAPGSKEVFALDLGAAWLVLQCRPRFVCTSS